MIVIAFDFPTLVGDNSRMYQFDRGFVPEGFLFVSKDSQIDNLKQYKRICESVYFCNNRDRMSVFKEQSPSLIFADYAELLKDLPRKYSAIFPAYEYLGDWEPGKEVAVQFSTFNNTMLNLDSPLPSGLRLEGNRLLGSTRQEGLIKFVVSLDNQFSKTYYLGSYSDYQSRNNHYSDNYMRSWYTGGLEYSRDPLSVYIKQARIPQVNFGSPLEEAKQAALKVKDLAKGREIVLFVSGGVDSQLMAKSFMEADVPFRPVFYKDSGSLSDEELFWVKKFYQAEGIEHLLEIKEKDFVEFINSYQYLSYAFSSRTNNPEMGLLLSFMNDFKNAYCVFAGGPNYLQKADNGIYGVRTSLDERLCKSRYMERFSINGCPEFLSFTPGLFHSTVFCDYFNEFIRGNYGEWKYKHKIELFKSWGFDVSLAPPIKMTGFETLCDALGRDQYGEIVWYKHRFPLKQLFPVVNKRNLIPMKNGRVVTEVDESLVVDNPDLFSLEYTKNHLVKEYN